MAVYHEVELSQVSVIVGERKHTRTGPDGRNQGMIGLAWYVTPLGKDELGGDDSETTNGRTLLYTSTILLQARYLIF